MVLQGCGALYVDKKHQSSIRCLTVSGGFGRGFTPEFIFRGIVVMQALIYSRKKIVHPLFQPPLPRFLVTKL